MARTRGAIALGPSGNAQGGHKFYTLDTRSVVVRRQWVRLPMTAAIIARIELLAQGQPSQPVSTDRKGLPIGDIAMELLDNYNRVEADDDLPGVHLPEPDESVEIPGVGSTNQDPYEDVPDLADAFDVNVDFNSQANPQDLVHMDKDAFDPNVGETVIVKSGVENTLVGQHVSASKLSTTSQV